MSLWTAIKPLLGGGEQGDGSKRGSSSGTASISTIQSVLGGNKDTSSVTRDLENTQKYQHLSSKVDLGFYGHMTPQKCSDTKLKQDSSGWSKI